MIKKPQTNKHVLNLDGPEGNAFVLLATASTLCKALDFNKDKIFEELQAGDYNHLLVTFDKYFGEFVDLETNNEEYLELFA